MEIFFPVPLRYWNFVQKRQQTLRTLLTLTDPDRPATNPPSPSGRPTRDRAPPWVGHSSTTDRCDSRSWDLAPSDSAPEN